jgi:hypothetical protein
MSPFIPKMWVRRPCPSAFWRDRAGIFPVTTSAYSYWLNHVEIWVAKIEREVIARGIFTSVSDLARKLRRHSNAYSAHARPIQWRYSDPTRRARSSNDLTATGH